MTSSPLRVFQLLRAPVGGLFRHVYDLTRELASRGHEIGIVVDSLHSDELTAGRLRQLSEHAVLGIHPMPIPRLFGMSDIVGPLKVRALADRLGVEVLHGHGAKGGLLARLARVGSRRVALYTPHGGVLNFPPGSGAGKAFRAIEHGLAGSTDAFIFESTYAEAKFREEIVAPRCAAPVIHNGVARSEFEPITPASDACDFVFIGEFRPVKGIPYLLEALAGVLRPDGTPATMALVGSGADQALIEAQIAELRLADRVRILGAMPARDALRHGRCEVVPSLAESLPYVVLEASAAGLPVVATDVGGIREIFGPTAHRLVAAKDSGAFRRAMQEVLTNPQQARTEAVLRQQYVRAGFSLAYMTDQIEALYRAVLAQRVCK